MSITPKIFAATGIAATAAAFALFATGTMAQSASPSPASTTTVLADNPWGQSPALATSNNLNSLASVSTSGPDDNPWG